MIVFRKMPESPLIAFYRGLGPDNSGRYLRDVQQQSLHELEAVHNYIQWLFPLPEPSAAVPDSPVLMPEDIVEFRKDAGLTLARSSTPCRSSTAITRP